MSYARFGIDSDVYVYSSSHELTCCGCGLQERRWVPSDDPAYRMFKGYLENVGPKVETEFTSNEEMIAHLDIHRRAGDKVPEYAYVRLRDPKDAAANKEMWRETREREKRDGTSYR